MCDIFTVDLARGTLNLSYDTRAARSELDLHICSARSQPSIYSEVVLVSIGNQDDNEEDRDMVITIARLAPLPAKGETA